MILATAQKTTPAVYLLWNGIPFDELGLMEHLLSASFTVTVKKGGKSHRKKTPKAFLASGDPKVGAASLKFKLDSRIFAHHMRQLLFENKRPVISIAAAHDDNPGDTYWLGSYMLDSSEWAYGESAVNELTLTGVNDKAVGMAERTKPRVWTGTTARQILEDVAKDHDVTLDMDLLGDALNQRMDVCSPGDEDDWSLISRLSESLGAAAMYLDEVPMKVNLPNSRLVAQGLYEEPRRQGSLLQAEAEDAFSLDRAHRRKAVQINAKRILRLARAPGFLDLSGPKATRKEKRVYVLGYGPGLNDTAAVDALVQGIEVKESGYRAETLPAGGGNTDDGLKVGLAFPKLIAEVGQSVLNLVNGVGSVDITVIPDPTTGKKRKVVAHGAPKKAAPTNIGNLYRLSTASAPVEAVGQLDPSYKLQAIALSHKFVLELSVRLNPGLPFLRPPQLVEIQGTDAHDAQYGVEESALEFDGTGGMTSRLSLRPIGGGAASSKKRGPSEVVTNLVFPTEIAEPGQSVLNLEYGVGSVDVTVILEGGPPPPSAGSQRGILQPSDVGEGGEE